MASRNVSTTYIQAPTTASIPTSAAPVAASATTITTTYLVNDNPSSPAIQ